MSVEENKQIVRRFFEEVYNKRNLEITDELQEPEYARFEREWIPMWRRAFPDFHVTIDRLIGEGDQVVAAITVRGTHQGELSGELIGWLTKPLPATGKQVEVKGIFIYQIVNGKLKNEGRVGVADWLAMLRQLGAVPQPAEMSDAPS